MDIEKRPRSNSHPQHTLSKVALLWTQRKTALFRPLPKPLCREICSYLHLNPQLMYRWKQYLWTFDYVERQWKDTIPCWQGKLTKLTLHASVVCLEEKQLFWSGGFYGNGKT